MKIVTDFDEVYIIYYNDHNGEWSILDDALYLSEAEAIEKAEELNKTNRKKKAEVTPLWSFIWDTARTMQEVAVKNGRVTMA
jgi:hypothetical protein